MTVPWPLVHTSRTPLHLIPQRLLADQPQPEPPLNELVTFTAPCPRGHLAEWVERRHDTRTEAEVWCPVCVVGPGSADAAAGGAA